MNNIPYLSEQVLRELDLSTHDVINCIEAAIVGARDGTVRSAPKAVMTVPEDGRYMMAALAAMDDPNYLTVKTVVLNPANPDEGLPQINGLVTVLDSRTGLPVAIIDGNWITAVRTAGLSAVASKYLARRGADSIGFIGCGVQAHSHLVAFNDLYPLKRVKIFGRGQSNIDRLATASGELGLQVAITSTGQQAIEDVDLVVTSITATTDSPPFLDADGLRQGAFATITDLGVPWHRDSLANLDRVVIDDLDQEAAQSSKLCDPSIVSGDLSGLVLGDTPGRSAASDRTAFLFRGHALGDLALSVLAMQNYRHRQS